jgi:hypothetical protein
LLGVLGAVSTFRHFQENWLQIHFATILLPLGIGVLYRFDICRRLTRIVDYTIAGSFLILVCLAILGSAVVGGPFQSDGFTNSPTLLLLIFLALGIGAWWSARLLGTNRDAFWKESPLFRKCCVVWLVSFTLLSFVTGGTLITYDRSSLSSSYSSDGFQTGRLADTGLTIPAVIKFQYADGISFAIIKKFITQQTENGFSSVNETSYVNTLDTPFPEDAFVVDVSIREKRYRAFYERSVAIETQCHIQGVGRYSSFSCELRGEFQLNASGIIDHAGHMRSLRARIRSNVVRQIIREAVPKFNKAKAATIK